MRRLLPLALALALSLPAAAEPARGTWAFSVLVPGLGQAFLGEPGKGLVFALGTYGALSLIPVSGAFYAWFPILSAGHDVVIAKQAPDLERIKSLWTVADVLFYTGLIGGALWWTWAAVDAFVMEQQIRKAATEAETSLNVSGPALLLDTGE